MVSLSKKMTMDKLYYKDNKGLLRVWIIRPMRNGFEISHGFENGGMQHKYEEVAHGKAGRSHEEQVALQIASRIKRQIDKGYVYDITEAFSGKATNAMGFLKPMLAVKYDDVKIDYTRAYVQRKYDGNRCIITNTGEAIVAYSRNGKPISTINHIISGLDLGPGQSIDGELYCHGESLQVIMSWTKRYQEDTLKLKFHAYDLISNLPFHERIDRLKDMKETDHFEVVSTVRVFNRDEVFNLFDLFRQQGYEGAIIRHTNSGYEDGKRSKSLVKLKAWLDEEFVVFNIIESKDGWARLVCLLPNDLTFVVTCHGDMNYKKFVLANKFDFIGKKVTVEYAYKTSDGIPFHPVAKCWRE